MPNNNKQTNDISSIQILSYLYSVLIALALTTSVRILLESNNAIETILFSSTLWLFFSFIITIIPFYHGAVQALVTTFEGKIDKKKDPRKAYRMFITFAFMISEGIIFFAIASSILSPITFALTLVALFIIDIIWIAIVKFLSGTDQETPKEWAIMNLAMTVVILILFWPSQYGDAALKSFILFIAACVRTASDYYFTWKYYFRSDESN